MIRSLYHHSNVLPAFATIAEPATSEANRMLTVPLAVGLTMPSTIATLPVVVAEVAFEAAGVS